MIKELAIIMCPPLSIYAEKPSDISVSKIVACPHCDHPMWFSIKKEMMKEKYEALGHDIFFGCHECFVEHAKKWRSEGLLNNAELIEVKL